MKKRIISFLRQNPFLLIILIAYILILLSVVSFGIPNNTHPFTYHMDEWHQLMAVRALFKHGSSNIEGAANGPIFFFFLSGVFLAPFYVLRIVDPLAIKSSVTQLLLQERLFEVLRLSSLFWGMGAIILVWQIAKKFLKISPVITTLFFTSSPIWLMLSSYFKYDIALLFFLLVSLYTLFAFCQKPTRKRFLLCGIAIGCTVSIKISALPLGISYILAYFLFTQKKKRSFGTIFYGGSMILLTFLLVGIPDSIVHFREYYAFFYYNIVTQPQDTANFSLPTSVWIYLYTHVYPLIFGHGLYLVFFVSVIFVSYRLLATKAKENKQLLLLFITMLLFILSVLSLKIQAIGNRVLVLLPFMAFSIGILYQKSIRVKKRSIRYILISIFVIALAIQSIESVAWMQMKLGSHPRQAASLWMQNSLSKQTIGLENIPIYQQIPDIAVKEFYTFQENPKAHTTFTYTIVDEKTVSLPKTIVVTNVPFESVFVKDSPKKMLIKRLQKEGYKEIKRFYPFWDLYSKYADPIDVSLFSLVPSMPISIFQK